MSAVWNPGIIRSLAEEKIYTKTVRVYEINFAETKAEEEARRQTRENEQVPPPAPENSSFMDIPEGDGEFPFR